MVAPRVTHAMLPPEASTRPRLVRQGSPCTAARQAHGPSTPAVLRPARSTARPPRRSAGRYPPRLVHSETVALVLPVVKHARHRRRSTAPPAHAEAPRGSPSTGDAEAPAAAAAAAPPQVLAGKTVAVVGGGPGGMLCAAHLARLGAAVDVFESRGETPAASAGVVEPPAVWNILLGPRSKEVIEAAGISSDFGPRWMPEGGASYRPGQPAKFFGRWVTPGGATDRLARATQRGISEHLRGECGRVYGNAVRVHYGMRAVGGDVCAGEVILQDAAGEQVARAFDMVVGADGVGSVVRRLMQQQDAGMHVKVTHSVIGILCALVDSPGHPSTFAAMDTPSGEPFHGTPDGFDGPLDGCITGFVMPAPDGPREIGFCALSVRHGGAEVSLAITGDAAALRALGATPEDEIRGRLEAAYPQLPSAWLRQTAEVLHDRAVADDLRVRVPTFVTCSKLASGRAVLLGDAAHAVSPNVGLGCASALQDSEVLSRACIAAGGVISAAAQQYNTMRIGNAHTLTHISRRIDATQGFRYHRNPVKALVGLPYFVAQAVANMSDKRVPAFLRPGFSIRDSFTELDDWTGLKAKVRWYGARLAAIFLAAAAAAAAAACKLFALLRTVQL